MELLQRRITKIPFLFKVMIIIIAFFHRYTCSIEISQGTLNHSEEVNVYPIDIPQIVETDDGIVEVSRQFLGRL